jgi:hypothetical protein
MTDSRLAVPLRRRFRALLVGAIVSACALSLAGPAAAQAASDPTATQYATPVGEANPGVGNPITKQHSSVPAGKGLQNTLVGGLPFTGLDLVVLVAVALLMTFVGFALRRLTADRKHQT